MTGSENALPFVLASLFPLALLGLWLGVTQLLASLSGWNLLAQTYPDRDDIPRVRFRMQSISMKSAGRMRVNFNRCLTIDACSSGLRFRLWRLSGPFQDPFLVPWKDIAAEPGKIMIFSFVRIRLARWPGGEIMMPLDRWNRVGAEAPQGGLTFSK